MDDTAPFLNEGRRRLECSRVLKLEYKASKVIFSVDKESEEFHNTSTLLRIRFELNTPISTL